MAGRQSTALRSLRYASGEASAFINGIATTSERLAERSSEALVGTFGGILGVGAGIYGPALLHASLLPFLTVPLGGAFGIVVAMMLWRGPRRMLHERKQRGFEMELTRRQAFALSQLKKLGPHGDPALIAYFQQYPMSFVREVGVAALQQLPTDSTIAPKSLPPPAADSKVTTEVPDMSTDSRDHPPELTET